MQAPRSFAWLLFIFVIMTAVDSSRAQLDFHTLDKWRPPGAQRCALVDCNNGVKSSGSHWNGLVADVRKAEVLNDSAARDLEYFASIVGGLDDYSRGLIANQLSDNERNSISRAYEAVTQRFQSAMATNRALRVRIGALELQIARLQARLSELEATNSTALSEIVQLRTGITNLREEIVRSRARLARVESDASSASALAHDAALSARAARTSYWALAGTFFDQHSIGSPRDFMPPVEAASATTARRRIITQPSSAISLGFAEVPIVARAAVVPQLAAAAEVPMQIDRAAFLRLMSEWNRALDSGQQLESHAEKLAVAAQLSADLINERAKQATELQRPLGEGQRELRSLQSEAAALEMQVTRTVSNGRASLSDWFDSSRETLTWQLAEESLRMGLSPAASAAQRFNMVGAMARAYKQLFEEDMQTVLALLGPNPPDDAIDKYESLLHLESTYGREMLAAALFPSLGEDSLESAPPEPRLKVVRDAQGKVEYWETRGGVRMANNWIDGEHASTDNIHQATRLTHLLSHTEKGAEEFSHYAPYRGFLDNRLAGNSHTVFDVRPNQLLDFVDDVWEHYRSGEAVVAVPELCRGQGNKCFLIDMGRTIARTGVPGSTNPTSGPGTQKLLLIIKGARDFVTAYPVWR